MLNWLRHWHWILLHQTFGLPDRDHTKPYWRSHPAVPAHHPPPTQRPEQSLHAQLEREMRRQPQILKPWQRFIGSLFIRADRDHSSPS
jgi:hypothetical protein